ncbi:MAG TPA: hypothetical protein VFG45_01310 [Candidatus Nitrosocosmicus sp.]|nr:hypothetical protein [Candidatus Nitrosocosmicus sp.]
MSCSRFGREAEYITGLFLSNNDWLVFFSKGSRGPADIVAKRYDLLLLIQVKSSTKIPRIRGGEIHDLLQMSNSIRNSYPILTLVHPNLDCNTNANTIVFGNYLLNFFLLPEWTSINPIQTKTLTFNNLPNN